MTPSRNRKPLRCGAPHGARRVAWLAPLLAACLLPTVAGGDEHEAARQALVTEIRRQTSLNAGLSGLPAVHTLVLEALGEVPRHRFVPTRLVGHAYANRPLPIGYGQTISQPYIVALMTDLLEPEPDDVMLEVGTGSGYQAAVLATLVRRVYTIEIIAPLAGSAAARLRELGYDNVTVRTGDGYYGWPEHGPFDGIVVTAAAMAVPPPLIAQLRPGGRMVIPVGAPFHTQDLIVLEKDAQGQVRSRSVLPVAFVPLTGSR